MKAAIASEHGPYATDNLRFRKAYIRERLAALKLEREALVTEREKIDAQLNGADKRSSPGTVRPT